MAEKASSGGAMEGNKDERLKANKVLFVYIILPGAELGSKLKGYVVMCKYDIDKGQPASSGAVLEEVELF